MNTSTIVQKLWNYCNVLRALMFAMLTLACTATSRCLACCLKMSVERTKAPYSQKSPVPAGYDWNRLAPSLALPRKRGRGISWGDELFDHYRHTLEVMGLLARGAQASDQSDLLFATA